MSMMHCASRYISRLLKGRTLTATFTDDILIDFNVDSKFSVLFEYLKNKLFQVDDLHGARFWKYQNYE